MAAAWPSRERACGPLDRAAGHGVRVDLQRSDRERDAALDQELRLEATRRTRLALSRELGAIEIEWERPARGARRSWPRWTRSARRSSRNARTRRTASPGSRDTVAGTVADGPGGSRPDGAAGIDDGHDPAARTGRSRRTLFAPSRSIGFVRSARRSCCATSPTRTRSSAATRAGIRDRAQPAPHRRPRLHAADGSREPLYRIKAELESQSIGAYGKPEPLRPGMQVEADILLDRRRLIEWIFEPLLSLAGGA
jgi:membrane fusion protein